MRGLPMAEARFAPWHDAATALVFLTRIPVPWAIPDLEARLPRSTPWFPVIGAGVGLVGAAAWWGAHALWGPLPAAIAAVAATVLVTGAFHEDGLADTFDGLGGSPERERALEIMKDSRLGSYGALALMLTVIARIVALLLLGSAAPAALVGAHALARFSSLPLIRWLPYARADGGTGKPFAGGVSTAGLGLATLFTAVLTALLWRQQAAIVWLAAAAIAGLLALWFRLRIRGITGDTLGAANQLVELTALLALAAM